MTSAVAPSTKVKACDAQPDKVLEVEEKEEERVEEAGNTVNTTTENPDTTIPQPLKVLPSPADSERRRMVLTVPRGQIPHSFSLQQAALQLDGSEREHEDSEVDGKEDSKDKMVQPWMSRRYQGDYTINDPTITCGHPRDLADLGANEDAAEVIDPNLDDQIPSFH